MGETVSVTLPVDSQAAQALQSPGRREALGRFGSGLLKEGRLHDFLADAIRDAKAEARAKGLTDQDVETELEAWRAEPRA